MDFSNSYNELRPVLMQETGGQYREFIQKLQPDYSRVWFDIGFGYLALAVTLWLVQIPQTLPLQVLAIAAGAAFIGFWIAYLHLFLHEAAHYNLHPDRKTNDLLCDLFISWLIGLGIANYRIVHFQHHRKLGETHDSERSYFKALTWRYLTEMLTGIQAVRVFFFHKSVEDEEEKTESKKRNTLFPVLRGIFMHAIILAVLILAGAWPSALAWALGIGIFFPFFASLRQLLEHRSSETDPKSDHSKTPHGALTRLFGNDAFSRSFGGAGFNRHLLHHWEPQVSYTRLADLEAYLLTLQTTGPIIQNSRSSYWLTFKEIFINDNRR